MLQSICGKTKDSNVELYGCKCTVEHCFSALKLRQQERYCASAVKCCPVESFRVPDLSGSNLVKRLVKQKVKVVSVLIKAAADTNYLDGVILSLICHC